MEDGEFSIFDLLYPIPQPCHDQRSVEPRAEAVAAVCRYLVPCILRLGGLDGGKKNRSLDGGRDRLDLLCGGGRGWLYPSAFDPAGFRGLDFGHVSHRLGGFSCLVGGDFLRDRYSDRAGFAADWS